MPLRERRAPIVARRAPAFRRCAVTSAPTASSERAALVGDLVAPPPLRRQQAIDDLALVAGRARAGQLAPSSASKYGTVLWQKTQVWFQTPPARRPGRSPTITE